MRDFRLEYADQLRQKWVDSLERCNKLFAYYNELTNEITNIREGINDVADLDFIHYQDLVDHRLICEADLVAARSECLRAYDAYYFEFPFLAAFEEVGGDFD